MKNTMNNNGGKQPRIKTLFSPKLSIYLIIATFAIPIIIFQFHYYSRIITATSAPPTASPWRPSALWESIIVNTTARISATASVDEGGDLVNEKLRESITFLPLKDLRYSSRALDGHTWFMSSMYDTHEEGEVQYQRFPSQSSKGRVLCLKGRDTHDGVWNSYALAWRETLPHNATFMEGTTFVSYNHYNYDNIWHGLSATMPLVAWHIKTGCSIVPKRWVLYYRGELRTNMASWLRSMMEAAFEGPVRIEGFDGEGYGDDSVICFEDAVVMRHCEGGMSRDKRIETYDLLRCKARRYCNVSSGGDVIGGRKPVIGMTMFMRTGARSFKNDSAVIGIFERECQKVEGCRFMVSYSDNLTFCEQVKVMSLTDILISPHGAQLTNMFLMDKNSSVMEFYPKGWLKVAGVGQYVYKWIASWSGMKHEGAWRDPEGDSCPYPEDDRRCMSIYKNGRIGYNETYFSDWAKRVLDEVRSRKTEEAASKKNASTESSNVCSCGQL